MVKDLDLFAAAMAGVKPLKRKRAAASRVPAVEAKAASKSAANPVAGAPKPLRPAATPAPRPRPVPVRPRVPDLSPTDNQFDRDVSRALSRRKLSPEASIDLHGMTLAAAERAVTAFLARASAQDMRVVLVVTGKGLRREGERLIDGRIRAEFVGWLNRGDNRERVRAVRAAHAHHGGTGAFYLLLRRRSSASSRSLRATPQR
ncbi:Smr/MutS family protein [Reyranella aquatilis]|uniref:Smr/MutS family protein n=1 Tax=Reyranella aquatilis TaxID=2035356 RepID=A0ABS8L3I6_9HYPH|nr:Smr/MutS family protein [Reyranella aquatilis]MCC8432900.1 Smr/MutS family protein [Reyranella aquatilis]